MQSYFHFSITAYSLFYSSDSFSMAIPERKSVYPVSISVAICSERILFRATHLASVSS